MFSIILTMTNVPLLKCIDDDYFNNIYLKLSQNSEYEDTSKMENEESFPVQKFINNIVISSDIDQMEMSNINDNLEAFDDSDLCLIQGRRDKRLLIKSKREVIIQKVYYDTSMLFDLSQLKMPYINCNRDTFISSGKDLIDILLLDKNLKKMLPNVIMDLKFKFESIGHSLAKILDRKNEFEMLEEKNYALKNILGVDLDSKIKKQLNDILIKINAELNLVNVVSINRNLIEKLLIAIDKYIFEDLEYHDIFFLWTRPSQFVCVDLINEFLDFDKTVYILKNIINIYNKLWNSVELINFEILKLTEPNCSKSVFTSCVLIKDIFTKWYAKSINSEIITNVGNINNMGEYVFGSMIIYSNNVNSTHELLSKAIELIADDSSVEVLANQNIQKIAIPNDLFHTPVFSSYEIDIFGKKYLIKKFSEADTDSLPSGLSTAYLNTHEIFTSVGYLVFGNKCKDLKDSIFMSVEEKMDAFFKTDNFEIFKNNENQIWFFVTDFLVILNKLNLYKIKLSSSTLLFAVNMGDKRWRFRVDDIAHFEYVENENPYANHDLLINTLNSICSTIEKGNIHDDVRHLMEYAEELKSEDDFDYIGVLISYAKKDKSSI